MSAKCAQVSQLKFPAVRRLTQLARNIPRHLIGDGIGTYLKLTCPKACCLKTFARHFKVF